MNVHEKLNYVEFPANDISATKTFFSAVFGWSFKDFGDDYSSFVDQGLNGGIFKSVQSSVANNEGVLLVFYSNDIETTQQKIEKAGGEIVKPIFAFPGGRRFHFTEPSGNEFAVWSE